MDEESRLDNGRAPVHIFGFIPRWFLLLGACIVGLIAAFIAYGVVQERIMTLPYIGEQQEKAVDSSLLDAGENRTASAVENGDIFREAAFLVLVNRIVATIVTLVLLLAYGQPIYPICQPYKYFIISLTNNLSTWCQYEALKYVNFPTATLTKTGKMIPVMILGSILFKKTYGLKDYAVAITISIGCTVFILSGDVSSVASNESTLRGVLLVLTFLLVDGMTSTLQESLFVGYAMPVLHQMFYVNCCILPFVIVLLKLNGGLSYSASFIWSHPRLLGDALLLAGCSTTGQIFIYSTIKYFSALTYATVMTTRQVMSIVLSCMIFFHPLTIGQFFGGVLAFGALYYRSAYRASRTNLAAAISVSNDDSKEKV